MACQVVHAVEKKITVVCGESRVRPRDFPGGPVVKNAPCNAGDMGSIPGQGTKIPHAERQLSPGSTTRENPMGHKKGS